MLQASNRAHNNWQNSFLENKCYSGNTKSVQKPPGHVPCSSVYKTGPLVLIGTKSFSQCICNFTQKRDFHFFSFCVNKLHNSWTVSKQEVAMLHRRMYHLASLSKFYIPSASPKIPPYYYLKSYIESNRKNVQRQGSMTELHTSV